MNRKSNKWVPACLLGYFSSYPFHYMHTLFQKYKSRSNDIVIITTQISFANALMIFFFLPVLLHTVTLNCNMSLFIPTNRMICVVKYDFLYIDSHLFVHYNYYQ